MASTQVAEQPREQQGIHWSGYLFLLFITGLVVLADQWTKAWVRAHLSYGESIVPFSWMAPYARIMNWRNAGASFGMFQDFGGIFTVLAIIVALMIIYYFPRIGRGDWALRLAMGLQLGGALGNLVDRLQRGYVTDFVSVGTFPVFNVADASITLGVIILLLDVWLGVGEPDPDPVPVAPIKDEWPSRD